MRPVQPLSGGLSRLLLAFLLLIPTHAAIAVPMLDATVSPIGGGAFHYEFSVTNDTVADLFLVTITDAPLGDPLIAATLTAPAGFLASYDSGLGLLDFIADIALFFPPGITSGFAFDSLSSPAANFGLFDAFSLADFPVPISGQVNIVQVAPVAEPGIGTLFAIALAGLTGVRRLNRFAR